jgi:FkbM family methyltransferase
MNLIQRWLSHLRPQAPAAGPELFSRFTRFRGESGPFLVCPLGTRTRPQFIGAGPVQSATVEPGWPEPSEEYFEWLDILEAVDTAQGTFTMLELGAGYGRWAVRGALAARQKGLKVRIGLAEAEPQHALWLRQHLDDNQVGPDEARVYEAAVSDEAGRVVFCVSNPGEGDGWYGQSIVGGGLGGFPVVGDYFGSPLVEFPGGARVIAAPQIALADILADYDAIDLIDFDLQGAEGRAIASAIAPLTAKVMRMHIGTHGPDIEDQLRALLPVHGWRCVRDFGCQKDNDTPYGSHPFNDGIQTWVNVRLERRRR